MSRHGGILLYPGDFHFAGDDTRMHTLLGSCVSITLWHPRLRVGGMCHYMVPSRGHHRPPADRLDGRYADEAVQLFLKELHRLGTTPREYQAKMFGAGNQFPDSPAGSLDIPRQNIAVGMRLLDQCGFVLTTTHLGGTGSRRLTFDVSTGIVWLKYLGRPIVGSVA